MKIYPTIAEALTLGGSKLAVDGVVLVGEHGKYPRNEKGQTLYPRYEFFKQIVEVFRDSGRVRAGVQRQAPVLELGLGEGDVRHARARWASRSWPARSLPVTWRTPSLEMPLGARVREALCVGYGGVDSYDFHGLETHPVHGGAAAGGETGVQVAAGVSRRRVLEGAPGRRLAARSVRGRALPQPHADARARRVQRHLPDSGRDEAAGERPGRLPVRARRRPEVHHVPDERPGARTSTSPRGSTASDEPFSTQMYLPMPPARTTLANFFSPLVNHIEQMFLTGKPTYPVERTLLTTGPDGGRRGQPATRSRQRYETPHLAIAYQPTARIDVLENADRSMTPDSPPPPRIAVIATDLSLPLARAAHRRTGSWSAIPRDGALAPARRESRLALRRPEAGGRSERRPGQGVRLQGLSRPSRKRCAAAATSWRWTRVLIIGEHGDYPRNEKGQILYPRYEFFKQCVDVFEKDGRAVPVYNDKHLSYSFEKAK